MQNQPSNPTRLNRRSFLGYGLAASVTAVGPAAAVGAADSSAPAGTDTQGRPLPYNPRTFDAMPTRNLGRTGHRAGIFSLGGQAMIQDGSPDLAAEIVNQAIDSGVNYIDTAPAYGKSESHIGPVLATRRGEVYLASKTHKRGYDDSMRLLEQSLRKLQTNHLDCWQIHNLQTQAQLDEIFADNGAIKALEKARDEGVVRFLGITGHYDPQILVDAIQRFPFDTLLMAFNAADRHQHSFIEYLLPTALEQNLGIIGMKVATRGRMLSTWTPPPLDQQPKRMATDQPGKITIKEALFYNFSIPAATNIVGCDNPAQVRENVQCAAEFTPYNDAAMAQIEARCKSLVYPGLYFRKGIIDRQPA